MEISISSVLHPVIFGTRSLHCLAFGRFDPCRRFRIYFARKTQHCCWYVVELTTNSYLSVYQTYTEIPCFLRGLAGWKGKLSEIWFDDAMAIGQATKGLFAPALGMGGAEYDIYIRDLINKLKSSHSYTNWHAVVGRRPVWWIGLPFLGLT